MGVIEKGAPRRAIDPSESAGAGDHLGETHLRATQSAEDVSTDESTTDVEVQRRNIHNVVIQNQIDSDLILAISTQQRFNARRTAQRQRTPAIPIDHSSTRSKKFGVRKQRRYENQQILRNGSELGEDGNFGEVTIDDFLPNLNVARAFSIFLQEKNLMDLWSQLGDCEFDRELASASTSAPSSSCMSSEKKISTVSGRLLTPEDAFNGICRNLRVWLKQRHLPLGMMEILEETLLDFFNTRPTEIFISAPLDSFQRGLLHALSQYNNLQSNSLKCRNKRDKHPVRIINQHCSFSPPKIPLVEFLEKNKQSDK